MNNQTSKPAQDLPSTGKKRIPFFMLEEFNPENEDHISGHLTIKMNPTHAYDLCELIADIQLEPEEGHILAMISQIRRWYRTRKDAIRKSGFKRKVTDSVTQEPVVDKTDVIVKNTGC